MASAGMHLASQHVSKRQTSWTNELQEKANHGAQAGPVTKLGPSESLEPYATQVPGPGSLRQACSQLEGTAHAHAASPYPHRSIQPLASNSSQALAHPPHYLRVAG